MTQLSDKLKDMRKALGLSQAYVSNYLGISRSAVAQIESGNRRVSSEELAGYSKLFQVSADYLLGNDNTPSNQAVFARSFSELSESDQREIINLITFKRAMSSHLKD